MNGYDVAMWRMMGSDAFNVWQKQFTRGFLRCDIVDYFEKLSDAAFQTVYEQNMVWYGRFYDDLKIGETLTIRTPQRLRR